MILGEEEVFKAYVDLEAGHFHNVAKSYREIESVRGRVSRGILMSGSYESPRAEALERSLSRLNIELSKVQTTEGARKLRDQIFYLEQNRWEETGTSGLRNKLDQIIPLNILQSSLGPDEAILEYMLGDNKSYCLVIKRSKAQLVPIPQGQHQINSVVLPYLEAVRKDKPVAETAQRLRRLLLPDTLEIESIRHLIVVPDGSLHLLPFEALQTDDDHYLIEAHDVIYAPSASTLYFLRFGTDHRGGVDISPAVLAIGGVPYSGSGVGKIAKTRGYDADQLGDLPASEDEARAAAAAIQSPSNQIIVKQDATESAFKKADLLNSTVIHLAVHGLVNQRSPDRAALIFLSDPKAGEDGWLQASEIALLKTRAQLVVISACDSAVGPVNGEEGISNLSRAFLLSGASNVLSSLWTVDDTFSLFLMKHFYTHLAQGETITSALRYAKLDLLQTFHTKATPYFWAGFKLEGNGHVRLAGHSMEEESYVSHPVRTH